MTLVINRPIVRALEDALEHLDLDSHGIGVATEHREAMKLYLETYVEGPLALAIRAIVARKGMGDSMWLAQSYGGRL